MQVIKYVLLFYIFIPLAKSGASAMCASPAVSVPGEGIHWPPGAFQQQI